MQKPDFRRVRELLGGCTLLATLLVSGAFLGYWLAADTMRQAHVEEIGRLQEAHRTALQAVVGTLQRAAVDTAQAAGTAAAAAETAQGAAAIADKAAKAAGAPINPEIVAGAAIPVVLWVVWRNIRRIHAKLQGGA